MKQIFRAIFPSSWLVNYLIKTNPLKWITAVESVGSSTRIEAVKLTDQEVEALLTGIDICSFRSRDEQEVTGYAEAINLVFFSYDQIPISENHI